MHVLGEFFIYQSKMANLVKTLRPYGRKSNILSFRKTQRWIWNERTILILFLENTSKFFYF